MSAFTVPDANWLTHWGIDPGDEVFDQEAETLDGYVLDTRWTLPPLRWLVGSALLIVGFILAAVAR